MFTQTVKLERLLTLSNCYQYSIVFHLGTILYTSYYVGELKFSAEWLVFLVEFCSTVKMSGLIVYKNVNIREGRTTSSCLHLYFKTLFGLELDLKCRQ